VEHEPVTLVAEVDRKIKPDEVKWFFRGKEITLSDRDYTMSISDNKVCSLILFNPRQDISGEYTINIGGATSTAKLTVKGKPRWWSADIICLHLLGIESCYFSSNPDQPIEVGKVAWLKHLARDRQTLSFSICQPSTSINRMSGSPH